MTEAEEESKSRVAIGIFKERMFQLEQERSSINGDLGAIDIMGLARRTRQLLRNAKNLMDGNVTVLFAAQPARMAEELYKYLEYAEGHVMKALSEEYEFEAIKRRLYMSTTLARYVIEGVQQAVQDIEARAGGDGE
ncbi:MAG TPA: hypothetical protein DEV93_10190 [Chloroflexi bacterium]|jgi:acylphosphatase|nr:hypothetical protein [Chloroflexota bacterium]